MALPRLSGAQPIAGSLPPTRQFLQFMEETRKATEKADTDLQDLIDQLAAQLELILETRAVADEALAAASDNAGSKVAELASFPGGSTASQTVSNVPASPYLELAGSLTGGTLDADADWTGTASLTENDGTTTNVLMTVPVVVTSNGLVMPGPEWGANDSSAITFAGFGTYAGTVTYALSVVRTGGSNFVGGATISATLKIMPGVV